jgi:hypothetical protein
MFVFVRLFVCLLRVRWPSTCDPPFVRCCQVPACLLALLAIWSRLFSSKNRRAMRLALTATVSVVDVGSDLYSVSIYYRAGRTGLASGLLSTVLLSMLFQMMIVCVVHRHHGKLVLTVEILLVLSGMKPFIDVWRMVHGHVNVGAPMDVQAERTACKVTGSALRRVRCPVRMDAAPACQVTEVVCESVPGAILLAYAFLEAPEATFATVFSMCTSCASIAVISTGIFFSFDTDPERRLHSPMFYGAVPDSTARKLLVRVQPPIPPSPARRRARASSDSGQVSLFTLVLAHATGKLISIPILLKTSPAALAAYLAGSMAVYLIYKLARGDFRYWVPTTVTGLSLFWRVLCKLFVDFAAAPQFRHPFELGGAFWLFTLFETQAVCVGSCLAYWHFYDGEDKIDDAPLFISLAMLVGTWVVALGTFLLSIDRAYLHTFVSIEIAPQFVRRRFAHFAGNDEQRMEIFQIHAALWRAFADEVADWVAEHYNEMVGQPWFTPAMVQTIPGSMLPTIDLTETESALPACEPSGS